MNLVLFSLEQCLKCEAVKGYLRDDNIKYKEIKLPHDKNQWTEEQKLQVDEYGILKDLEVTAPILVVQNTEDKVVIGQLRIKKWIQDYDL